MYRTVSLTDELVGRREVEIRVELQICILCVEGGEGEEREGKGRVRGGREGREGEGEERRGRMGGSKSE